MKISKIPDLEIPNLDSLTRNQVRDLVMIFSTLKHYCEMKERAMLYRIEGDIIGAKSLEDACDRVYKEYVPNWLKW